MSKKIYWGINLPVFSKIHWGIYLPVFKSERMRMNILNVILLTVEHWWHWWGMGYGGRETNIWLWDHSDSRATINNAIEHFLYVESFREEQKICLNLVRRGHDVFAILPTGSGRPSFSNNERNQRKSWRVNFHDHHRCASRSHNETKNSSDLE